MRATTAAAVSCLVALGVVAGCGGTKTVSSTSPTTAAAATSAAATSAAAAPATTGANEIAVTETEFTMTMSTMSVAPGTYTFTVKNDGKVTHALSVDGPGVEDKSSDKIAPGATGTVTVTLTAGMYDIYCPIADHQKKGMDMMLMVA